MTLHKKNLLSISLCPLRLLQYNVCYFQLMTETQEGMSEPVTNVLFVSNISLC